MEKILIISLLLFTTIGCMNDESMQKIDKVHEQAKKDSQERDIMLLRHNSELEFIECEGYTIILWHNGRYGSDMEIVKETFLEYKPFKKW